MENASSNNNGGGRSCASAIPVIDLAPWTVRRDEHTEAQRCAVAMAVGQACQDVGFFAIQNHGVDPSIVEHAWSASAAFFDLPLEQKLQHKSGNDASYPYGFENSEVLSVGKQRDKNKNDCETSDNNDNNSPLSPPPPPPDLKETFSIGPYNPKSGMPARRMPKEPKQLESALEEYYKAMEVLALQLLQIMAVSLQLPEPETWFQDKMDHHCSALRILNYFPIHRSQMQPGQLRASAHTDYGALTILKSGGPGLQVKKDLDSEDWVDVPHLPDAFVINLGDMMRQWTNDKWLSTLHRVIVTKEDAERRQAIAYFCNVNGDCIVDPNDLDPTGKPKYPPITAKDHLMAKHLASMGAKKG